MSAFPVDACWRSRSTSSGCALGARERMTMVAARLSRPACARRRRHCRRRRSPRRATRASAPGSPTAQGGPRCTRPAAASPRALATWSSHSSPRNRVPVASTTATHDNDCGGRCRKTEYRARNRPSGLRATRCGRAPSQISTGASPICRTNSAHSGVAVTPGRPSSHRWDRDCARPCPPSQVLPLDDDGRKPVVGEPQRARHAGGAAADDRHERRFRHHTGPQFARAPWSRVARCAMVRQSGT